MGKFPPTLFFISAQDLQGIGYLVLAPDGQGLTQILVIGGRNTERKECREMMKFGIDIDIIDQVLYEKNFRGTCDDSDGSN